ncbi:MAG: metal-dependent transcriptional regulator [Anaerolineae bacterium]|nr:metal-dependent transcriptional regulator [Anaerolineae bacterium]
MRQERVEEYLGAVYRLREDADAPVPLSRLTEYFGFSPVSVHEMVQKLEEEGWVHYHPYRGVTLSGVGLAAAMAVLRRHRLWERFLTDKLALPWDEAHEAAGDLEHAATEEVTERLATFLGEPDACPHGAPIPPQVQSASEICLCSLPVGAEARVSRIAPETPERLRLAAAWQLTPGRDLRVLAQGDAATEVLVYRAAAEMERTVAVPFEHAQAIWLEPA